MLQTGAIKDEPPHSASLWKQIEPVCEWLATEVEIIVHRLRALCGVIIP